MEAVAPEQRTRRSYTKRFEPRLPHEAAALARQAAQALRDEKQIHNGCAMCGSPDRERLDMLILSGVPSSRIIQALGRPKYAPAQVRNHRDKHLAPLLEALRPTTEQMQALPWPQDGDRLAKARYYALMALGLMHEALRRGQLSTALGALREMRQLDLEILTPREGAEVGIPIPAIREPDAETRALLERAIARSGRRGDTPEPTDGGHGNGPA